MITQEQQNKLLSLQLMEKNKINKLVIFIDYKLI